MFRHPRIPHEVAPIATKILGNVQGLKASQTKLLTRLYNRRYPGQGGYTPEQARELAALSFDTGRQVGLLIDRRGRPQMVIVGDAASILIPDLSRARRGTGRLRAFGFCTPISPPALFP